MTGRLSVSMRPSKLCLTCQGTGKVRIETKSVVDGKATVEVIQCRQCAGTGTTGNYLVK